MKLLFASDSFKGTISSEQTVEFLTKAAHEVFGPCETIGVPVADGGEGTTDAVILARKGVKVYANVHGPLMEKANAYYGKLSEKEAVLEMAQASGLPMVPEELRNPLNTTTYGTGELVKAALDAGFTEISIAIGGSATNDGGNGRLQSGESHHRGQHDVHVLVLHHLTQRLGTGIHLDGQVVQSLLHPFVVRLLGDDHRLGSELAGLLHKQVGIVVGRQHVSLIQVAVLSNHIQRLCPDASRRAQYANSFLHAIVYICIQIENHQAHRLESGCEGTKNLRDDKIKTKKK